MLKNIVTVYSRTKTFAKRLSCLAQGVFTSRRTCLLVSVFVLGLFILYLSVLEIQSIERMKKSIERMKKSIEARLLAQSSQSTKRIYHPVVDPAMKVMVVRFGDVAIETLLNDDESGAEYTTACNGDRQAVSADREPGKTFTISIAGIEACVTVEVFVDFAAAVSSMGPGCELHFPLIIPPRRVRTDKAETLWAANPLTLAIEPGQRFSMALEIRDAKEARFSSEKILESNSENVAKAIEWVIQDSSPEGAEPGLASERTLMIPTAAPEENVSRQLLVITDAKVTGKGLGLVRHKYENGFKRHISFLCIGASPYADGGVKPPVPVKSPDLTKLGGERPLNFTDIKRIRFTLVNEGDECANLPRLSFLIR